MPYEIKLNGKLSEEWCVGDQITCTYENTYYDQENERVEADVLTLQASDWQPEPFVAYKPVIYLYPEKETDVSVEFALDGRLTCTYPKYSDGWVVTAAPDGTLTDKNGQTYNYLYWEGETYAKYDMSKGFCVKGKDTAAFWKVPWSNWVLPAVKQTSLSCIGCRIWSKTHTTLFLSRLTLIQTPPSLK